MASTRNTVHRREIIETLAGVQGFISAQELHGLILRRGKRIALATVYAQLRKLVDSGDIDAVMTDRGENLFRRCDVDVHHHHLSCRVCGATVDVDTPELEQWTTQLAARHGYSELRHVVELNGLCPSCQSR